MSPLEHAFREPFVQGLPLQEERGDPLAEEFTHPGEVRGGDGNESALPLEPSLQQEAVPVLVPSPGRAAAPPGRLPPPALEDDDGAGAAEVLPSYSVVPPVANGLRQGRPDTWGQPHADQAPCRNGGHSTEGEIRKKIIEADLLDCAVALPGQLFYSTPIVVCLSFLAPDKKNGRFWNRRGEALSIGASGLGSMVDRTHLDLADEDIAKIAATYRPWSGDKDPREHADVPGFCGAAKLDTAIAVNLNELVLALIPWPEVGEGLANSLWGELQSTRPPVAQDRGEQKQRAKERGRFHRSYSALPTRCRIAPKPLPV